MSVFGATYVVDTNSLAQLGRDRRSSPFFRERVRLPSEVLHEAQGFPDIEQLRANEYTTTAAVLRCLVEVMATVAPGDTRLVDLYANKGGADALVVACALDGRNKGSRYLDAEEWFVVTADHAVRDKAQEFGLAVRTNDEFASLIDETDGRGREQSRCVPD